MKRAAELKPSRKARTKRAELIHKQLVAEEEASQTPELSHLESLPIEVFEQIFFHCLELNLPRASPYLARALSRPVIYSALVLFAFYEAGSTISHVETHHFLPAKYRRIIRDDRIRLQAGIHQCRWFTLEVFESCIPILSHLHMVECWYRERRALSSLVDPQTGHFGSLPSFHYLDALLPALDDKAELERYFSARAVQDDEQLEDAAQRSKVLPSTITDNSVGSRTRDGYFPFISTTTSWAHNGETKTRSGRTVLAVRVLPARILRGAPWTDEKVKLLQLLRQGMHYEAPLERKLVVSVQALYDGMASAIREGNEKALLVLLELHTTIVKYPARITNGDTDYPPSNVLPLRLFHLACDVEASATMDTQSRTMLLLFRGGIEGIPSDDRLLTRWATHITTRDASSHAQIRMARWLLSCMAGPGYHSYSPHEPWGGRSFTDEVGYLCPPLPSTLRWSLNPPHTSDDG